MGSGTYTCSIALLKLSGTAPHPDANSSGSVNRDMTPNTLQISKKSIMKYAFDYLNQKLVRNRLHLGTLCSKWTIIPEGQLAKSERLNERDIVSLEKNSPCTRVI